MYKFLAPFILGCALAPSAFSQHVTLNSNDIICYASDEITPTYVDDDLIKKAQGRVEATNMFELVLTDVPSAAESTISFATDIWSEIIRTDFPIKISINWLSLSDGVLGSARPASYEVNFDGAPKRSVAYPIALAERLARKELNEPDDLEIYISLNKEYTWHYNYEEPVAENTHDLLSVVLHEIGHGLGLADTYSVSGDDASWGTDGRANIYDFHIYNDDDEQIITSFNNYSGELYSELTSNKLSYGGILPPMANAGQRPKIYAPSSFNGGSSISHLDESSFPAGDINSLMTPQLGREEAIHSTGPIVNAMLAEMGYVYAFIDHDSVPDELDFTKDVIVNGTISSDSSLILDESFLVYSFDSFTTVSKAPLTVESDQFSAVIPAPGYKTKASFYFELKDVNNLAFRNPTEAAMANYEFGYGLVTGIESTELVTDRINLYPNPVIDWLTVSLASQDETELIMLSITGKTIVKDRFTGSIKLNMDAYDRGMYILQLRSSAIDYSGRVILK